MELLLKLSFHCMAILLPSQINALLFSVVLKCALKLFHVVYPLVKNKIELIVLKSGFNEIIIHVRAL